jgi:bacteriocin resistance YdeI/OmpD-like protein
MPKEGIAGGVVHKVPADLRKTLVSSPAARAAWEDITPLARNEWICWVLDAKKPETRGRRIELTRAKLLTGMRGLVVGLGALIVETNRSGPPRPKLGQSTATYLTSHTAQQKPLQGVFTFVGWQ